MDGEVADLDLEGAGENEGMKEDTDDHLRSLLGVFEGVCYWVCAVVDDVGGGDGGAGLGGCNIFSKNLMNGIRLPISSTGGVLGKGKCTTAFAFGGGLGLGLQFD